MRDSSRLLWKLKLSLNGWPLFFFFLCSMCHGSCVERFRLYPGFKHKSLLILTVSSVQSVIKSSLLNSCQDAQANPAGNDWQKENQYPGMAPALNPVGKSITLPQRSRMYSSVILGNIYLCAISWILSTYVYLVVSLDSLREAPYILVPHILHAKGQGVPILVGKDG